MNSKTRKIILTGLMIAVIFISTFSISIPIFYGYINLGDASIFISAYLLGPFWSAIAAGVGSALSDYYLSYTQYILPTLIIKSLMAIIASYFITKKGKIQIFGMILSGFLMVIGYYVTEILLYGNYLSPLANIPWNTLQFSIGIAVALFMIKALKKAKIKDI